MDINIKGKKIRIFASHFQSFALNEYDYKELQKLKYEQVLHVDKVESIFSKLRQAFQIRNKQTRQASEFMSQTKLASVLLTDLNDVPNSIAYNTISKDRKDAFVEASKIGIGRTYLRLLPTLRIDYIFPDNSFSVKEFMTIKKEVSDHYPIFSILNF